MSARLILDCALPHGDIEAAFEIPTGVSVLFGPSGAGKTSLLNAVAGLTRLSRGEIAYEDGPRTVWSTPQQRLPVHRRGVGYVFQEPRLFPHLSVAGNLDFAEHGHTAPPAIPREELLARLGLSDFLDRKPATLSGGERQRVAIARALLSRPRVLLLDEPLANLDPARRAEILPMLSDVARAAGLPVLYVSHHLEDIVRLGERLIVIDQGRITAQGWLDEVFNRPEVRPLLGDAADGLGDAGALVTADHTQSGLSLAGVKLLLPPPDTAGPVRLRIRSRDVAISLQRPEGLSIRTVLPARLASLTPIGAAIEASLVLSDGQSVLARITPEACSELALRPGLQVLALVKAVALADPRA